MQTDDTVLAKDLFIVVDGDSKDFELISRRV